jgi:hypothetical protein
MAALPDSSADAAALVRIEATAVAKTIDFFMKLDS